MQKYLPYIIAGIVVVLAIILLVIVLGGTKRKTKKQTTKQEQPPLKNDEPVPQSKAKKQTTKTNQTKSTQAKNKAESKKTTASKQKGETQDENNQEEKVIKKYIIKYNKEEKVWVVKKTNAKKASKKFKTKTDAYLYAERLSSAREMPLTVMKKDGKFQKAENVKKSVKKK